MHCGHKHEAKTQNFLRGKQKISQIHHLPPQKSTKLYNFPIQSLYSKRIILFHVLWNHWNPLMLAYIYVYYCNQTNSIITNSFLFFFCFCVRSRRLLLFSHSKTHYSINQSIKHSQNKEHIRCLNFKFCTKLKRHNQIQDDKESQKKVHIQIINANQQFEIVANRSFIH